MIALWIPFIILAVAAIIDQRTKLISDIYTWLLVLFAVLANVFGWTGVGWTSSGLGLLTGAAVGFLLTRILQFGAGDAFLLAGLGAILGPQAFGITLVLIFLCGGLLAGVAKARGRTEIAYGPAIAGGYLLFLLVLAVAI